MKYTKPKKIPHNHSPWLAQLDRIRPIDKVNKNQITDFTIIGGGIAGVSTAFFTLKYTTKQVILIEADKIAHGATGHNAGQIVYYFERPFSDIVREYGLKMAVRGQKDIVDAWALLQEMYYESNIQTPLVEFTGYAGCTTIEQLLQHLKNKALRHSGGLDVETVFVSEDFNLENLPNEYRKFCTKIPSKQLLNLLETKDKNYFAALSSKKGLLNSAKFCEEAIGYLLFKYKERFQLFEHSPVDKVILYKDHAILNIEKHTITTKRVVLCTNGFEKIKIENTTGGDIDTKFHSNITSVVGTMSAIKSSDEGAEQTAITYFPQDYSPITNDTASGSAYYYLTRRAYKHGGKTSMLTCIGGPEFPLQKTNEYNRKSKYLPESKENINKFAQQTLNYTVKKGHDFQWHGLMGYTANGIRIIGAEPCNEVLVYNLGCNGVGILPSIYGGRRVARVLYGEKLQKSIFDPFDGACTIPEKNKQKEPKFLRKGY